MEEINKYYIQENLSEIERINYILKKGYTCQKENLIKNLSEIYSKNVSPQTIFSIIISITENIELWEKSIQLVFPKSLASIAINLPFNSNINDTIKSNQLKVIMQSFIKAITTLEKAISDEYICQFARIVEAYEGRDYKMALFPEVVEYATSLGKFGQSCSNRRFSVFLCSSLLRITSVDSEVELNNRFVRLCEDSERVIRFEVTYQLRFILKVKDTQFITKTLKEIIVSYLSDGDMIFKTTLLESILMNLNKFDSDFIKDILLSKVNEIFDISDYYTIENDFNCFKIIFQNILRASDHNSAIRVIFIDQIRKFLKRFFITKELKNSTNVTITFKIDYCIERFNIITRLFLIDNDITFVNELVNSLLKVIETEKDNQLNFYQNLHIIMKGLPKEIVNMAFIQKVFYFLSLNIEDECYDEIQDPDNAFLTLLHFNIIIETMIKEDNDDFITFFFNNFIQFKRLSFLNQDWRLQIELFKGLKYLPSYLMRNYFKYKNYDDLILKLFVFSKESLNEPHNFLLEKEIARFIPECLKYSWTREEILKYVFEELYDNQSFYRRRLFISFIRGCFDTLSIEFIKTKGIYDKMIELIKGGNVLMSNHVLILLVDKMELFSSEVLKELTIAVKAIDSKGDIELGKKIALFLSKNKQNNCFNCSITCSMTKELEKIEHEHKIIDIETMLIEASKKEEPSMMIKKSKAKGKCIAASLSLKKKDDKLGTASSSSKTLCKIDDSQNNKERKNSLKTAVFCSFNDNITDSNKKKKQKSTYTKFYDASKANLNNNSNNTSGNPNKK